jgi:hypothetical protein
MVLNAWDLAAAQSACNALLTERADIYRPDPVTGVLPGSPHATNRPCAVEPIARIARLGVGGGGPETPVRWELRFAEGEDVQARDQVRVTTFSPVVVYQVVTLDDPHTNSLLTMVHAEVLE